MRWTEGHVWKYTFSGETGFMYKYVVLKDGQPERWEEGPNRYCVKKFVNNDSWNECVPRKVSGDLSKSKFTIIRHANSKYNFAVTDPNYQGDPNLDHALIDSPLSDLGLSQCQNKSYLLPGLKLVLVSPLVRTLETAYHLFKDHPNFQEIKFLMVPDL